MVQLDPTFIEQSSFQNKSEFQNTVVFCFTHLLFCYLLVNKIKMCSNSAWCVFDYNFIICWAMIYYFILLISNLWKLRRSRKHLFCGSIIIETKNRSRTKLITKSKFQIINPDAQHKQTRWFSKSFSQCKKNTITLFVCPSKILHKHCFQFLLGP